MHRGIGLIFVFVVLALSTSCAEIVQWRPCAYPDSDPSLNCTIHEVFIDPCKEAAEGKPCKIRRGNIGNITITYTPDFSADRMQGRFYWANQMIDIPFLGMDSNACLATTCPVVSGSRGTYNAVIAILKKYPVRMYDLKWKIWNDDEQECCLMFQFKITK